MRKLKYYIIQKRRFLLGIFLLSFLLMLASLVSSLGEADSSRMNLKGLNEAISPTRNPIYRLTLSPTRSPTQRPSHSTDKPELKENLIQANEINRETPKVHVLPPASKCIFQGSFEDDLNKLSSLKFEESKEVMQNLGFDETPPHPNTSLPVFVSGFNSGFFGVAQGLIKTVHENLLPTYPDLKLIIYDLGLTESQVERLHKYGKCEVRTFPYDKVPDHVRNLKNFAFKPIIINMVFQEFGSAWWVDASARFTRKSMELPFAYIRENGLLFFTYDKDLNVAFHTHPDTFAYFHEDPCPYKELGEIEAGNVAFLNSRVSRVILRQWVACALVKSCITPHGARLGCPNPNRNVNGNVGACHRYDQSVLSIILRRLYHQQNDYPDWEAPFRFMNIQRGHRVDYFPSE